VPGERALLDIKTGRKTASVDVVLPLVHGTYGEDGCLQGLLEMADLPYCGCDVLGSSIGMDKAIQKRIWRDAGISVVPWVEFSAEDWKTNVKQIAKDVKKLGYPVFVKPVNLGSSVGITRVNDPKRLSAAIKDAFRYDIKVIVEKGVQNAREIELSILGSTDNPIASVPGEVIPSNEFYDYASKYLDGESELIIPAALSAKQAVALQDEGIRAFRAVGGSGFARVDFLIDKKRGHIFLNEVNTLPGFTEISMFPKLWEASGLSYTRLLDKIVALAAQRHKAKSHLNRDFSQNRKKQEKKGGGRK
jgi:D-alanine-D-alanine ligase